MNVIDARLVAIAVGAVVAALAPLPARAADTPQQRGRAIAESKCARCHAVGRAGASPVAIAPPFRTLPQRYPVENLAEALAEGIVVGHPMMPEFKLAPPDIEALLSYIDSLAKR